MPLASMSNVTSICGTPRGAGAIPVRSKVPSGLLSRVNSRSPWNTWIVTDGWLSVAVEKVSLRLVGMAVLRSMSLVMIPPVPPRLVSMPRESGVTSMSSTSDRSPEMTPACRAAPMATTSSGLTPLLGSRPPVRSLTTFVTAGMRVEPPTSTTWSMSETLMPESRTTLWKGAFVRSRRSLAISSNFARVSVSSTWIGPESDMEMYGREMFVDEVEDNSFLAFSAASFRRWRAILSFERSTPDEALTCSTSQLTMRSSQSSPPSLLSPEVARTWMVEKPSSSLPTSKRETSKVPPPRSKTRMSSSSLPFSRP